MVSFFNKITDFVKKEKFFSKNERAMFKYLFMDGSAFSCYKNSEVPIIPGLAKNEALKTVEQINWKLDFIISTTILRKTYHLSRYTSHIFSHNRNEQNKDLMAIDGALTIRLNKKEMTGFNDYFFARWVAIVLSQRYILGLRSKIIGPSRYPNKISNVLKSYYLISADLENELSLPRLVKEMYLELNKKITKPYLLTLDGILQKCGVNKHSKHYNRILSVSKSIIKKEFEVEIRDESIHVKENSKPMREYFTEVLELAGTPLKVHEVIELSKKIFPHVEFKQHSFIDCVQRFRSVFVSMRKSRTYGLKKWKYEKGYFVGGTIPSIVEKYLNQFEEPRHITEVTEYVKRFKPDTDEDSIRSTIHVLGPQRFLMRSGFIGLSGKKYKAASIIYKHIPKWEQICDELEKFIKSHAGKMPSAVSQAPTERNLYYFIKRARKASVKNRLSKERAGRLKNLGVTRI